MEAKELIKYFRSLGIEVHTSTKARGNLGFFLKNRIDISKNTPENRVVPTLIHEFAHYIHYGLEPEMNKTGGSFEILFGEENPVFTEELFKVTNFVDENSLCIKLYEHKDRIKKIIKDYEAVIKKDYPDFQRSKKFKEFDKYIKKSKARYLLKYDRVKLIGGFFKRSAEIYSVSNVENDFPEMPKPFAYYIKLRSAQKKQTKISARINRLKKYYTKPCELFARLVEGIYLDKEWVCALAPFTTCKFFELLNQGYYGKLNEVFKLCHTCLHSEQYHLQEEYPLFELQ